MIEDPKKHYHLDIRVLPEGGYIIRDSIYNFDIAQDEDWRTRMRREIVCFSTLEEMLTWLGRNFENKPSRQS